MKTAIAAAAAAAGKRLVGGGDPGGGGALAAQGDWPHITSFRASVLGFAGTSGAMKIPPHVAGQTLIAVINLGDAAATDTIANLNGAVWSRIGSRIVGTGVALSFWKLTALADQADTTVTVTLNSNYEFGATVMAFDKTTGDVILGTASISASTAATPPTLDLSAWEEEKTTYITGALGDFVTTDNLVALPDYSGLIAKLNSGGGEVSYAMGLKFSRTKTWVPNDIVFSASKARIAWTLAVRQDNDEAVNGADGYPFVFDRASITAPVTAAEHIIKVPPHSAGDILVLITSYSATTNPTVSNLGSEAWVLQESAVVSGYIAVTAFTLQAVADLATATTVTVTKSATGSTDLIVISGTDGEVVSEKAVVNNSTTVDFPAVTMGASTKALYLLASGFFNYYEPNGRPANFGNSYQNWQNYTEERKVNDTGTDPASYTIPVAQRGGLIALGIGGV